MNIILIIVLLTILIVSDIEIIKLNKLVKRLINEK